MSTLLPNTHHTLLLPSAAVLVTLAATAAVAGQLPIEQRILNNISHIAQYSSC
jgi:hypothetical protein